MSDVAPHAWRLAPGVLRLPSGRLAGGSPMRAVLLSETGSLALARLLGTASSPPPGSVEDRLAASLADRGLLLAPALPATSAAEVTVAVPARSDLPSVLRLLAALPAGVPVIVVDDGSSPPLVLPARPGLTVLRHDASLGPAAARNAGAACARTRQIAFVDVDVTPPPGCIEALAGYLDHGYDAVAPRIVSATGGLLERHAGGLDLGPHAATVLPNSRVSYVASALLMVDRAAFAAAGGFDEGMHVAEDVDLVWRLADRGRVAYVPHVVARHAPRTSWQTLRRRAFYGTGAATLERRHPGRVRHAEVGVTVLASWVALVVHPLFGVAAAAALLPWNAARLTSLPVADAVILAAHAQRYGARALCRWLLRPMWPVTALAAWLLPSRRTVIVLALSIGMADVAAEAWRGDPALDRPARDPGFVVVRLLAQTLADAAYSIGVWQGCVRGRTVAPLLPRVRGVRRP